MYPTTPTHKSKILNTEQGSKLDFSHGVSVVGNYCFVVARTSSALNVIDVSNKSNPLVVAVLSHGDGGAFLTGSENIEIVGDYAYVSCLTGNALEIINISDPTNPYHVGTLAGLNGANQTSVNKR